MRDTKESKTKRQGIFMSKKSSISNTVRTLTLSAMLVAFSMLFASYAKAIPDTFLRITFENLPILFGAVLFGPFWAGAIACCADILSCVLIGGYAPNPILTCGIVSVGLVAGIICKLFGKQHQFSPLVLFVSVFAAHIVGNMIIKSYGLYYMGLLGSFKLVLLYRVPNYILIATCEYIALLLLFRNKAIRKLCNERIK